MALGCCSISSETTRTRFGATILWRSAYNRYTRPNSCTLHSRVSLLASFYIDGVSRGSLLRPQVFLCGYNTNFFLSRLQAAEISVRLGEYNFKTQDETRSRDHPVAEIIEHENFVLATYENDIAIVRLQKPTSFNTYIWPICLPPIDEDFENETVIVAGWGQQYFAGPVSEVLLQVSIPVWPQQKCVDAFVQRITDDNICAAGFEGGKDSCLVRTDFKTLISKSKKET